MRQRGRNKVEKNSEITRIITELENRGDGWLLGKTLGREKGGLVRDLGGGRTANQRALNRREFKSALIGSQLTMKHATWKERET